MAYEEKEKGEEEEILRKARDELRECIDGEAQERALQRDDLRFMALDQWPSEIRREREGDVENGPRPCLTIDKVNQYRNQVVNDLRQGKPGINVRPQDDSSDVQTAKILKGLVRNIEDQSNADIAYMTAAGSAVDIGLGYFRIITEYVNEESFDQDIFIRAVPNTFSVYMGRHSEPDGSDAEVCFIAESCNKEKFKELYPGAKFDTKDFDGLDSDSLGHWITEETITVVEKYCFERTAEELYFLADGTTMPKSMYDKWPAEAGPAPSISDTRRSFRKQLKWYKMTGIEVLDSRDLPGKWIPVVEVVGREAWVDGKRHTWGIVRPAKDSLRMYNYWASTITERMALAPKTPFIGAKGQFEGLEDRWRKANRTNQAYLEYNPIDVNGNAIPPPIRQGPPAIEAALLQQMQVIEHDVQASLGIFKAGVGESESQQSGRAILALQSESDTGTYHFGANLGISIRHAGRIIVDLIPHYYDTKRVVRILGEDGETQTATLMPDLEVPYKQTSQGALFNPSMGKYDVSVTVGPSYNTKRQEAMALYTELAKGAADPISAAILRYQTVKNSDTTGTEEASKMLRAVLPPAIQQVGSSGPNEMPPEAAAAVMQEQQKTMALQEEFQKVGQENQQLKAGAQAKAMQTQADHDAKMKQLELDRIVEAEKAKLKREQAEADFALAKWKAEQEINLQRMVEGAQAEREERKMSAENEREAKKMASEQEQRAFDNEMTVRQENEKNAASVMPQLEKLVSALTDTMKTMVDLQQQTLAEMKKPKQVTLGAVQTGADGKVKGATVAVH